MPFRQHIRVPGRPLLSLSYNERWFNNPTLQRLDIRGKIKQLHGQNRKTEEPPLALFCICTPFGPPSLLEMPQKEVNSSFFFHQVTFPPTNHSSLPILTLFSPR